MLLNSLRPLPLEKIAAIDSFFSEELTSAIVPMNGHIQSQSEVVALLQGILHTSGKSESDTLTASNHVLAVQKMQTMLMEPIWQNGIKDLQYLFVFGENPLWAGSSSRMSSNF